MDTKGTDQSIVILQRLEFFIAHKIYSQVKLKTFLCMLIAWLGSGNMEKFWIKLQCLLTRFHLIIIIIIIIIIIKLFLRVALNIS